jgi:transposase
VTSEGRLFLDRKIYPDTSTRVLALIQRTDQSWPDKTRLQILLLICISDKQHLRAYFFKARKVSQLPGIRTLANTAITDYIRRVFAVETEIETLRAEHEQRGETLPFSVAYTMRQSKSAPVVRKFKEWVDTLLPGTPPNSALGKALGYCTRQWPKLVRFLDHGEIPIHNNFVERQIKQYALGRKLLMFCYDKVGAQASANLFSLVMTARANGVEPFEYLSELFEQLPAATTLEAIEALLPWNLKTALDARRNRKEPKEE